MTRYYLAHPVLLRHKVRQEELEFEKRTKIELVNPFYDGPEVTAIAPLDAGEITLKQYAARLNVNKKGEQFVLEDLKNIADTDGVVAVIQSGTPTIGTSMELWEAFRTGKPVYVVTDFSSHIWLRYVVEHSGGFMVENFKQLAARLSPRRRRK